MPCLPLGVTCDRWAKLQAYLIPLLSICMSHICLKCSQDDTGISDKKSNGIGTKCARVILDFKIEPESQTLLFDATMNVAGVLLAGVPGAGGYDAVFVVTLGDSSTNLAKVWSSHNVLALLVREDPCGVSIESNGDPRTMEIISGVSSVQIV